MNFSLLSYSEIGFLIQQNFVSEKANVLAEQSYPLVEEEKEAFILLQSRPFLE